MIRYLLTSLLLCTFLAVLARGIFSEAKKTENFKLRFFFCLVLVVIFKYDWGYTFHGLEYEDAYVFDACARAFTQGIFTDSYLINSITLGSYSAPLDYGIRGGHFIIYSVYLSWFMFLAGYSPAIASLANSFIAFGLLLVLSVFPFHHQNKSFWLIAPLIFCLAPVINVFCNTHLTETLSSLVCCTYLFEFFKFIDSNKRASILTTSFILFIALFTKRENLVLFIVPFIYCTSQFFTKGKKEHAILVAIGSFICLIVYLGIIQNVFQIEVIESSEIKSGTFSILYLRVLLPLFLESIANFNYFSVLAFLFLFSIFFRVKSLNIKTVTVLLLIISYFFIYSLHYRSFDFVETLKASEFSTYRYINNFFYLFPIFISYKLYSLRIKAGTILFPLFFLFSVISLFLTIALRNSFSLDEQYSRVENTNTIISYVTSNIDSILISDRVLIYQLYAKEDFNVCDIVLINSDFLRRFKHIYLELSFLDYEYISKRYSLDLSETKLIPVLTFDKGKLFEIVKE